MQESPQHELRRDNEREGRGFMRREFVRSDQLRDLVAQGGRIESGRFRDDVDGFVVQDLEPRA